MGGTADTIQFDSSDFNGFATVLAHAAQVGADVVGTADTGSS
jgi:hypothetical protein